MLHEGEIIKSQILRESEANMRKHWQQIPCKKLALKLSFAEENPK